MKATITEKILKKLQDLGIELEVLDIEIKYLIKKEIPMSIEDIDNPFNSNIKSVEVEKENADTVHISINVHDSFCRGEYNMNDGEDFITSRIAKYAVNCLLEDME